MAILLLSPIVEKVGMKMTTCLPWEEVNHRFSIGDVEVYSSNTEEEALAEEAPLQLEEAPQEECRKPLV